MEESMLAAVVVAPGKVALQPAPRPKIGPYDALTRTLASSFCRGTDRHLIRGTLPFGPQPPFILGHEGIGEVIAVGERCRKFKLGDRVLRAGVAYPPETPGAPRVAWGGFAEYGLLTDAETLRAENPQGRPTAGSASMQQIVPAEADAVSATVWITLKETFSALRRARLQAGQSVLILGTGPVGLGFAMCARAMGAGKIFAAGNDEGRLQRMIEFGADAGVNLRQGAPAGAVKAANGGRGVDLVIDAVGDRDRIGDLLSCVAPGGSVGLYGVPESSLDEYRKFSFTLGGAPDWWSLVMINPDEPSAHEEVAALTAAGKLDPSRFVTHTFPFAEFYKALDVLERPEAIKVVLTF